jgi:hypothetical protein
MGGSLKKELFWIISEEEGDVDRDKSDDEEDEEDEDDDEEEEEEEEDVWEKELVEAKTVATIGLKGRIKEEDE